MKAIYEELLRGIPDYREFLTAQELDDSSAALARDYPDVVSVFPFGKTKEGRTLNCMKIAGGQHVALMFGCPHPNEPIGTMMLEYFTRALAENKALRDELDYTWYIVKAWDYDGLMLNEKWLKGPYTLYNYSRNFFRPAGFKQVDWTFPIDYKELHFHSPIPETQAMMKLIDEIRPEFIYSLHNAGFGGVYWYETAATPEIWDDLHAAPLSQDVPMNLGEPEAPYCQLLAPAIYKELSITDEYDYLEKYGTKNIGQAIKVGSCSADYANRRWGSFTMLTEEPYFFDRRINDLSPADITRGEAALEGLDWGAQANRFLSGELNKTIQYMDAENPFRLALEAFTVNRSEVATRNMIASNPDFAKPATVAEKFDNLLVKKFYKLLQYGMLIRANELELERMRAAGEVNPQKEAALTAAVAAATQEHKKLADYLEEAIDYEVVPIRKLVYIQLCCGLHMAEYLKAHPEKRVSV